ncbi:hypothetical protein AAKU55_003052 [Oxalobacteraceae bacterium GrIS 1.11]
MKRCTLKACAAALFLAGMTFAAPASASGWPVFDAAVLAAVNLINASVSALNTSITVLLGNIGQAVNQSGQKVASTVEASAKAEREFAVARETSRRLEDARQRYDIPTGICAESGSGSAAQVLDFARAAKGALRAGGGAIASAGVAQAVNTPPVAQGIDAARAARIHAKYCDYDDHAAYGGSQSCPAIAAGMPGADKRFDSILIGAGPNGKNPDLTFTQDQSDAARMYVQNTVRRSVGPQLRKAEADTMAGTQYIGLMNQYNAIGSAAADPQEQRIADSQPNPITKALLKDAMMAASANAYFNTMASTQARSTGTMSTHEFETFEVGRRYANLAYQSDLQAMSGDNLMREQIRVMALGNWLTLALKNEIQKSNMIAGMVLASAARQEFEPILAQKYRSIPGHTGG